MSTKLLGPKLKHLWKTVLNSETGKHFTVAEITVYTQRLGGTVSSAYWYKILKGTHSPSVEKISALAKLFQVSTDYLLDDSIPIADILNANRVSDIRSRASVMSPAELRQVINDLQKMLHKQPAVTLGYPTAS